MAETEVGRYSTVVRWASAGVYPITQQSTLAGAVQIVNGPLTLQQSNDGTNWHTVLDIRGDAVEGSDLMTEISVSAVYLRVNDSPWPADSELLLSVRG